jgi:cytoskeletal protein RodZ
MRHIRNFLHNINDVVLAIVIVLLAAGIIYWRMQIIMDYPKQLANENAAVEQQEEAAPEEEAAPAEEASAEEAAPAEAEQTEQAAEEQPEG